MKLFQTSFTLLLCGFTLLLMGSTVLAQDPLKPVLEPLPIKVQPVPKLKFCPDLNADLTLTKDDNGKVTIIGTVINAGKGNYDMDSVAKVIMNLSYAPQYSYAMTGVSEILSTKSFTKLKAGGSFTIKTTFKIPDFGDWSQGLVPGNAKRLFTLVVVKQDMTPYESGEDCNPANNEVFQIVDYRAMNH